MSVAVAERPPIPVTPGSKLLGEVLAWSCPGAAVRHAELIAALSEAGLDPAVARELAPRHAFARACQRLSDRRIIRRVAEDTGSITFQFTAESRAGDRFEYTLETLLRLDKQTGSVTCDLPGLATLAQEELDRCLDARTGSDITRLVQRLFDRHADLFPIRPQGGVYFVPRDHVDFVDRVEKFVSRVGGHLSRFPVPAGTPHGDRSVKEAVASGLADLIAEHRAAVAGFDADTRPDTLQRAADRVRQARFKVEAYATYLAEERENLERSLSAAAAELRAKVASLTAEPATAAF